MNNAIRSSSALPAPRKIITSNQLPLQVLKRTLTCIGKGWCREPGLHVSMISVYSRSRSRFLGTRAYFSRAKCCRCGRKWDGDHQLSSFHASISTFVSISIYTTARTRTGYSSCEAASTPVEVSDTTVFDYHQYEICNVHMLKVNSCIAV